MKASPRERPRAGRNIENKDEKESGLPISQAAFERTYAGEYRSGQRKPDDDKTQGVGSHQNIEKWAIKKGNRACPFATDYSDQNTET